jgi:hypothetical protein
MLSPEREHSMTFFDLEVLLSEISNRDGFYVVAANAEVLRKAGIYERVLLDVFVGSPTNDWPLAVISGLLAHANRRRLRAAGNPLPSRRGPFLLYRGVAGAPPRRRVRGFSWTDSIESAKRFALRIPNLCDPAVYRSVSRRPMYSHTSGVRRPNTLFSCCRPLARCVSTTEAQLTSQRVPAKTDVVGPIATSTSAGSYVVWVEGPRRTRRGRDGVTTIVDSTFFSLTSIVAKRLAGWVTPRLSERLGHNIRAFINP